MNTGIMKAVAGAICHNGWGSVRDSAALEKVIYISSHSPKAKIS